MLDFNNILLTFQQMSGCDAEKMNGQIPLIRNAVSRLEDRLDMEKVAEEDCPRCEYAAACMAMYDFVCKEAARDKIIVTAEGKASSSEDLAGKIPAAERLKNSALESLAGILKDEDFLFETVGGKI